MKKAIEKTGKNLNIDNLYKNIAQLIHQAKANMGLLQNSQKAQFFAIKKNCRKKL